MGVKRTIGLFGATGVGVGAIVGGGILALAGVSFARTGPGALAAFALNGIIAVLTALSFAELSVRFPTSGGTYTFAKKVLTVETAFAVGWVVWFASVVAAVLYAVGFASFFCAAVATFSSSFLGQIPSWVNTSPTQTVLAIAACGVYIFSLIRSKNDGRQWINMGKVVVFTILIIGGLVAVCMAKPSIIARKFTPFLPGGIHGLISAMGYTFIALQGFDLIAAVAGEIKDPEQNIPRAMLLSLMIALVIYLPLLFVVTAVGSGPEESIMDLSRKNPETIIALAAGRYLGPAGYWLVMAAGILSMLSALKANLFAASRIAHAMAKDRTLFRPLEGISHRFSTPVNAVLTTGVIVIAILLIIPNVAAAGAASSLIFLLTFTLAHLIGYLARSRAGNIDRGFQVPLFPAVPVIGGILCMSLAIFQGVNVPSAGLIIGGWLLIGAALFLVRFVRQAKIFDAAAEASDPELIRLRGRAPIVLVPIANPASAEGLVALATAMSPKGIGHVLLLSVVTPPKQWVAGIVPQQLIDAQSVLGESLIASFTNGLTPEALTTIAQDPFTEIGRVARDYRCESILLGFSHVDKQINRGGLENLISTIDSDVVILRAQPNWTMDSVKRILVPVAGKSTHDELRSRLLSSICRNSLLSPEIIFLMILPENISDEAVEHERRKLTHLAHDEVPGNPLIRIEKNSRVESTIIELAEQTDLIVLGLQRFGKRHKVFGQITLKILRKTTCPTIMISHRG